MLKNVFPAVHFSSFDTELLPMTLNNECDLDKVKVNHPAIKYLG